ncbi:uncharacterized protein LOC122505581 [Leptopilina heterotoma]|uniref:uncharacterized protein LOC122505581 n=1 Tax=Leptopilina heterotoma TaxID=63436 RepID=UPI001CA9E19C|nr:uncharacterized protein LOC122505581 [Leptopilina heterotoma]
MLKLLFLFFVFGFVTHGVESLFISNWLFPKLVNRTNMFQWASIRKPDNYQGLNITKIDNGFEFLWLEEFDGSKTTLTANFNYIFENTGSREIIIVKDLCANYKVGSLEHDVQMFILSKFMNTTKCPIKKGMKATYELPNPYTYPTTNRECGLVDGTLNLFKISSKHRRLTPLVMRMNFIGNVTGPNCSN